MRRLISDVGLVEHPRRGVGRNVLLQSENLVLLISLSLKLLGRISLLQSRAILNYLVSHPNSWKGKRGLT